MLRPCRDKANPPPYDQVCRPTSTNRQWYICDQNGTRLNEHNYGSAPPFPPDPRDAECGNNTGVGCALITATLCNRPVCNRDSLFNVNNVTNMMDWLAGGVCNLCADEIQQTMLPGDIQCATTCPRYRWVQHANHICEACTNHQVHRGSRMNAEMVTNFCKEWASNSHLVPDPARPNAPSNAVSTRTRSRIATGQPAPLPARWRRVNRTVPLCACGRGEANHMRRVIGNRDGARFRRCLACFVPPARILSGSVSIPGPAMTGVQQRFIYLPDRRTPYPGGGGQVDYWDDDPEDQEDEEGEDGGEGSDGDGHGSEGGDGDGDGHEDGEEEADGEDEEMDEVAGGIAVGDGVGEEDLLPSEDELDMEGGDFA